MINVRLLSSNCRLICREMPQCKVKVLKMSAQATCKQFIVNLDQS